MILSDNISRSSQRVNPTEEGGRSTNQLSELLFSQECSIFRTPALTVGCRRKVTKVSRFWSATQSLHVSNNPDVRQIVPVESTVVKVTCTFLRHVNF